MDVTLTALLAEVRRHGSIPNTSATGSADSDLIAFINHNLTTAASEVVQLREGFLRRYKDHTISATQPRYRIPTRAVGNRLDAVLLLDSAGKVLRKLDELSYSNLPSVSGLTNTVGYHLEAGDVVLAPQSTTGATTLRMVYYIRPSDISTTAVDTASGDCFTITGVSGNVLTVMSSHGITTSTRVDVMKAGPPHEFLTVDELPSATGATTVTIADGSRVEIGDFLCKADKAPVLQLPDVMHPVVACLAAQEYWMALGDANQVERLERAIWGDGQRNKGLVHRAKALMAPRVEEGSKKIMSPYGVLGALSGPGRRVY